MYRLLTSNNVIWLKNIFVIAGLLTVIIFPLSIFIEFGEEWKLYFQLYPHMILFPLIFFASVLITLYQAFYLIRNQVSLMGHILIAIVVSFLLTYLESTSNYMMLLELKNTAQSTISNLPTEIIQNIQKIPSNILDTSKIINNDTVTFNKSDLEQALKNFIELKNNNKEFDNPEYHQFMKLGLSYSTWKNKKEAFSSSRWLYLTTFFIINSISLVNWFCLFSYSKRDVRQPELYVRKLAIASFIFFAWIPLRLYYNLVTKNLIFGLSNAVAQLDVFAWIIYFIYFFFLCLRIYQIRKDRIGKAIVASSITLLVVAMSLFYPNLVGFLFGLKSSPIIWLLFFICGLLYCLYQFKLINASINRFTRSN